jgi:hypothetical protein
MISSNKIIENLFTNGGEFVINDLKNNYNQLKDTFIGYYNILFNGKKYTGKTYTYDSKELIPVTDIRKQLDQYDSAITQKEEVKYFIEDDSISDQKSFKQISAMDYNNIASRPLEERRNLKLIRANYSDIINNMDKLDKLYPGFASYYLEDPTMDENIVKRNYSVTFDFKN